MGSFRHVIAVLVLLSAFASVGLAETVSVRGRVVEEGSTQGVSGARAVLFERRHLVEYGEDLLAGRLEPEPVAEGETDEEGFFDLDAPGVGMFTLEVRKEGSSPWNHRLTPLLSDHVAPAAAISTAERLAIRVLGGDGKPIEGALVRVSPSRGGTPSFGGAPSSGDGWLSGSFLGRSDAEGRVVDPEGQQGLPAVAGERMDVQAVAPGFVPVEKEGLRERSLTLRLERGRERTLSVRSGSRESRDAFVFLAEGWLPLGRTDAKGDLNVPLGEDEVALLVVSSEGARREMTLTPLDEEEEPKPVRIDLPSPPTVRGRVIDLESRRPVAGALVWVDPASWVRTDTAGAYELKPLAPEQSWVVAVAAGYLRDHRSISFSESEALVEGPTLALTPALLVSGVVRDRRGEPIAGVEIRAEPELSGPAGMMVRSRSALSSRGEAITDARGRFSLPPLSPEIPHEIAFRRTGYGVKTETVAPGEPGSRTRVDVTLDPGREAFGYVVSGREEPVANAEVRLAREADRPSNPFVHVRDDEAAPGAVAVTDPEGRFEIGDLSATRYRLEATAEGFAPTTVSGVEIAEGIGVTDLGTIVLAPGVALKGRVVDEDGAAIAGVDVWAEPAREMGIAGLWTPDRPTDAVTAEDGFFSIPDRREGERVNLVADQSGYARGSLAGVVVPSPEPVIVELEAASSVRGRVVDPQGEPVPGAFVGIRVERQGGGIGGFMVGNQSRTDDDGHFEVEEVQTGPIKISVRAQGYRMAEVSGHEVARGRDLEGVEIVLRPGATVVGTVTDGGGVSVIGARVSVVAEGGNDPGSRYLRGAGSAQTDGDGRYELQGVESGRRSLEAEHADHGRTVAALEVKEGSNRLDLRFETGHEVSGIVFDESNQPVGGANVGLSRGGGSWADHRTASRRDGSFRFEGIPPGRYSLTAESEEHARAAAPDPVVVEEAPVRGLEIRLGLGASLTGNLLGLTFDEVEDARVRAFSQVGGMRTGDVDFEGAYRISGLSPGDWVVQAEVSGTGRSVQESLKVEARETSLVLDLEFGSGLTLTGVVTHEERPLGGAMVMLSGESVRGFKNGNTDYRGRFRLEGIDPGDYRIVVLDLAGGLKHQEPLTLDGDREVEIEIRSVLVEGRVLDVVDRSPVPGASLSIHPLEADSGDPFQGLLLQGSSDDNGRFRIPRVPVGRWSVRVERADYSRWEESIDLTGGFAPEPLEVLLEPTEGLTLRVLGAGAVPPSRAMLAARDAAGRVVASGSFPTGEGGAVRLGTLPPGSYEIVVAANGLAASKIRATAPLETPTVQLVPEARLTLELPDLRDDPSIKTVTLRDSQGTLLEVPGWGGTLRSRHELSHGTTRIGNIPPGTWTVEVTLPDGEQRTEAVHLAVGENRVEM